MNNIRKHRIARRVYWLRKYKLACGCEICGFNKNAVSLDFAHKDQMTKHIEMVSRRGGNGIDNLYKRLCIKDIKKNRFYLKELINEVRLCRILCKNCHAVETENNREFHNSRKIAEARGGSYKDRKNPPNPSATLINFFG